MQQDVTLFRRDPSPSQGRGIHASLPPDLLEQVRGRLRLLTLFFAAAFAFDPLLRSCLSIIAWIAGATLDPDPTYRPEFSLVNVGAVAASLGLWWAARKSAVSPGRLHALGLAYEIVICFVIAYMTFWQFYLGKNVLPDLTWVPAVVIMFPLLLPGPPRRMLAASVLAGAMPLLALLALNGTGKVPTDGEAYVSSAVGSAFAIAFAGLGARVIYRLGREVAEAREMGSYRLEEMLGQGGMGEVWRARHRMLARPAAIKMIRPSLRGHAGERVTDEAVRRFEREAQVIATLRSPHTVDIFDFGVTDDGTFYYVMELLEGIDADALVRRFGPIPAGRAVNVLRQACHSLSEANSHGLIHRDIKPANIFLCRYGEDVDFVKVLDFGLVKALAEGTETDTGLTLEHVVRGTPAFIAPEQALGRTDLDGRVDIYSLGCVAYWLLTGEMVFDGETPMEVLMHHVQTPPVPPSRRTELPIPPALEELIQSCLAKDRTRRPSSARDLVQRLDAIEGIDEWTEALARQWWSRHQPSGQHRSEALSSSPLGAQTVPL